MKKELQSLDRILKNSRVKRNNFVNNLMDVDNIKVLVWTFAKTGTTTLASSFQQNISGTKSFKNVTHSHGEPCWFNNISQELKQIGFTFKMLIEYINSKGIRPVVIQSYRCPVDTHISAHFHKIQKNNKLSVNTDGLSKYASCLAPQALKPIDLFTGQESYINYLEKTFNGIWTHNFDKVRGYGFHQEPDYDILYTTTDYIKKLPDNIKLIKELKEYHNLKITKRNLTYTKEPGTYSNYKKTLTFERKVINHIYNIHSKPLNFFYTKDKIKYMLQSALNKYSCI
jgi:hypothetical protein